MSMSRRAVFRIAEHLQRHGGARTLMFDDEVREARLEEALAAQVEALGSGDTLAVDFDGVVMSSQAAREFLKRTLQRVQGGDLQERGIVLERLGRGLYNLQTMLEWEELSVVARTDDGVPTLLGEAHEDRALVQTYQFLTQRPTAVAREVRDTFGLKTVAAATNRLTRLASLGAVRRVGQEPAEGGGLQFLYAAVL